MTLYTYVRLFELLAIDHVDTDWGVQLIAQVKIHQWRQSIVKTVDSIYESTVIFHTGLDGHSDNYSGFTKTLHA